jgi:hypothetical protein
MALTDNLQAFYKLSDLTDSSGNGNSLINNGNVSFDSGKIGNAAVLNGTNSLDSNFVIPDTASFTIAAWFNPSQGTFALLGNTREWGQGFFELGNSNPANQDDRIRWYATDFTTGGEALVSDSQFSLNQWNHVALKRSGLTFNLFLNGALQSSTVEYSGGINSGSDFLNLGKSIYTHFNGSIDAVGIWNRALSDAEVAELYNSGYGGEVVDGVWTPAAAPSTLVKMQAPVKLFGKVKFGV